MWRGSHANRVTIKDMHGSGLRNSWNGRLTYRRSSVRVSENIKHTTVSSSSYEGAKPQIQQSNSWSSTENNSNNAWNVNFNDGNVNNNNKYNSNVVRPVAAYGEEFPKFFETFVEAFYDCKKGKAHSKQCIEYLGKANADLPILASQVYNLSYHPITSTCFLVHYPKWREVFAANFRDRIVHHWICQYLEPVFEYRFRRQGDVSFNCRKGYGTNKAVEFISNGIKRVTHNYQKEAWLWRGDLVGFFMSIDKDVMWGLMELFIRKYLDKDEQEVFKLFPELKEAGWKHEYLEILLYAVKTTIYHQPAKDCIFNTDVRLWKNLGANKSLLRNPANKGMPIGNLTTQLFANFYMSFFDACVQKVFEGQNYVYMRFVDDFTIVCEDKEFLLKSLPVLEDFLNRELKLQLHHDKHYSQKASHGVKIVGAVVKNNRTYLSNRTLARFAERIEGFSRLMMCKELDTADCFRIQTVLNSYLGFTKGKRTYNRRKQLLQMLPPEFYKYFYIQGHYECIKTRKKYKPLKLEL